MTTQERMERGKEADRNKHDFVSETEGYVNETDLAHLMDVGPKGSNLCSSVQPSPVRGSEGATDSDGMTGPSWENETAS